MQEDNNRNRGPSLLWLGAGALGGLIVAAFGLVERGGSTATLPEGAVARVNDAIIPAGQLERAVEQIESTYGTSLDAAGRRTVLEQLVEEELLVSRGIELGVAESDATVRAAIVQSLVASVTAEADAADPDDATLRRFLQDNRDRYTYASAMAIEAWTTDDERVAQAHVARIADDPAAAPPESLDPVAGLPDEAAPIERLRMFLGPAIAAAAADMPVGSAAVFARQGRWYVVRVAARESSKLADLDTVRSQVLIDYRRSLADERLREYVGELRRRADVVVSPP